MQKPSNIIKHELIGLSVEVVENTNKRNVGIKGKVIDETRNTLTIKTSKGEKKIVKENSKFMFTLPNKKKVIVVGSLIVGKPEIRIKKKAIRVRTKSGVFATKIVLSVENKGKEVTDLRIIDRLPAFTELIPEKFGTVSPTEIRKKTLIWHLDKLGKNEEIMFSYIVYSKVSIVGKLEIPLTVATYQNAKGAVKESKSNKIFVLASDVVHKPEAEEQEQ